MFEPGWILICFIENRLRNLKLFDPARLIPIPIFYRTPNFPIFFNQTINSSPSQTSMAATNMFEPGWILICFIENRLRNLKLFEPTQLIPIPIFYGTPNFPIFFVQTINSSPSQTSMAATNTFEPGWILIGSIEDCSRDPKQFDSAWLKPISIFYGTPNFSLSFVETLNTSPAQTSMAATNMFEPGWILIGFIEDRLGDLKEFNPARLKPNPIFYVTPNFPIFFNQTINSSPSQTSMAATNTFEPGWILIIFIEDLVGEPKQIDSARLRLIPIFYRTPNFPIIIVQTQNTSPTQTSMAATNMFEPGWILMCFIKDRLRDTKQFDPARLKPIPILYGTPNFPIIILQTQKTSPSQTFHGGYKYVWAGLNPDWFHWASSRGHKTIQSSPAQTYSHFLWNAKLPYFLCSDNKLFSISNFHGGYKYFWPGLNPDCFHWGSSKRPETIQSSPAQTQSHFLWDAKLP